MPCQDFHPARCAALSRRTNGEFKGIVSAAVDPVYFSPLLNSVLYAPDMRSAIAHGNGAFLLMAPENQEVPKMDLTQPGTFFFQHMTSGKMTTVHVGQTPVIQNKQAIVWTTIQPSALKMDYPLLAAVSRDYIAVFSPWRRGMLIQGSLFGLKWDDWMYRIYGRSRLDGEQTYERWGTDVHPDDRIKREQALNDAINGIQKLDTEFRIIRPDGAVRNINSIASAQRNANGQATKMFGVTFDVTNNRRTEARQLQLVDQLTRINDELNNFAYIASHDLKSPLRGIDQLATWITEDMGDTLSSDTQDHLRLMRTRINRMEMLLDDLLAYSRVGRSNDEIVEVNTADLVESIFELTALTNKQIKLNVAGNMPILQTKKVPLELIFRNLISNVIKHHDKAQGTIDISARTIADGFEFEVKDDGPGIPLEHQQRVFAMFQTLKPRDEVEGSGIGLALVKKAVESMGGAITLESEGNHGCTFRFTWPTIHHEEEIV